MKSRILVLTIMGFCGVIVSCNNELVQPTTINGTWNLMNISGGLTGINNDYDQGIIKWIFDSHALTLTVENNNFQNTTYDGFVSGIYSYSILESVSNSYIIVENTEIGGYTVTDNNLTIDQNKTSTGSAADGFIMKLNR
jgi:hypothetical protein